jgi:two-component system OmpR family sensor kinase
MSLRRRLVVGMMLLAVVGIVATDLVTASSLRSFLLGRLDEQVDAAQQQALTYIDRTYLADVQNGDPAPNDAVAWLAELSTRQSTSGTSGAASTAGTAGSSTTSGSSGTAGPFPAVQVPDTPDTVPPTASGLTGGDSTQGAGTQSSSSSISGASSSSTSGQSALPSRPRLNAESLSARVSSDVYVEVIDGTRQLVFQRPSGSQAHQDPPPVLPAAFPVRSSPPLHQFGTRHGAYVPDRPTFVLESRRGGTAYRAQAIAVPGGTLVTAIPETPTEETLSSLIHIEILVSLIVVVALGLLTLAIVRFGLRPLDGMTETAGAIAAGDLTRRIRRSDERSEVGRLGQALNGMLSQIEAAFRERTVSEARLRRFVADASHELRTPLTSIRGYAELLRKDIVLDEEGRQRALQRIEHEAARMGVLVDDLLLLARLDQGRPLEYQPVDVSRLASDAVEDARTVQPDRVITLEAQSPVMVDGDAGRLRQVFDNLLRNAAVHTPPSTPVHVSVAITRDRAVIAVADEGPGFDAEEASRVFDRFYRGDSARSRQGAGLGLSIVAALAQAHGGVASVESAPGTGTTFRVDLPRRNGSGEVADRGSPSTTASGSAVSSSPVSTGASGLRSEESGRPPPGAPVLTGKGASELHAGQHGIN